MFTLYTSGSSVPVQVFDALELCAGEGAVSRWLRYAGVPTASLDIDYWRGIEALEAGAHLRARNNPLDLLTDAGMATLGFLKPCLAVHMYHLSPLSPAPTEVSAAKVIPEHNLEAHYRPRPADCRHGL